MEKQHVFIVGSKGIPAEYGGFETFVDKLVQNQSTDEIQYHVARMSDRNDEFDYLGARVFNVNVPKIGPAKAVVYDLLALKASIKYCREKSIPRPIFYVLASRIGPFIHQINLPIRKYWKISENGMIKWSDLIICDSKCIEQYIRDEYKKHDPHTAFIAYGADTEPSVLADDDEKYVNWLTEKGLTPNEYYLVVGRFVPENNVETIIREFMASDTTKDLAIITTENPKLHAELEEKLHFSADPRIKFVGTVYDQELLKKIRENAWAYIHGHQVGGTNPSLLEALASTELNLLVGVGFNREVGENAALYWGRKQGSLANVIAKADAMDPEKRAEYGRRAKKRIRDAYSWRYITDRYEKVFLEAYD